MPHRRKPGESTNMSAPEQAQHNRFLYFSAGGSVADCWKWEVDSSAVAEVILRVLAEGHTIMFGTNRQGDAISIAISPGEKLWEREYVNDVEDFDDLMLSLVTKLREKRRRETEAAPPAS